jgi:hypothetical protein
MGEQLDPARLNEQLLDATAVAARCGWATRNQVSTNRRRYPDFPEPRYSASCLLWLRWEVDSWLRAHGRPVPADVPPGIPAAPEGGPSGPEGPPGPDGAGQGPEQDTAR